MEFVTLLVAVVLASGAAHSHKHHHSRRRDHAPPSSSGGGKKPNIVLVLTDDQDIELGSMNFMPKTLRVLGEGGVHFPNAYVTTPMCCPSRSSLLTGLYAHNHNVFTNNDNCSSPAWQQFHEPRTFATYLSNAGYRTAFIGKYLNEYNGSYIPPGWREWSGLVRNSRYYNYTVNSNGLKLRHGDDYSRDYYPDLIANESLEFLRTSKGLFAHKPVMMVLSFPAPHGPEDAAPQFQHLFHNVTTHRTPSWNVAPNHDKQWLLRYTGKMEPIHAKFTDILHTKRLQTLQSVDDAVDRLYKELVDIGEADNTYIFFTSDHGYHLGQFGLVKGKSMPFEFDVRVPFFVRGPGVPQGIRMQAPILNLDLAPTFLDIAGVDVPPHMDGKSILPLLQEAKRWNSPLPSSGSGYTQPSREPRKKKAWRESFLIERGKVNKEFQPVLPFATVPKEVRLAHRCQQPQHASPCRPFQKWECVVEEGRLRLRKCKAHLTARYPPKSNNCVCPPAEDDMVAPWPDQQVLASNQASLDLEERRLQRRFLKEHVKKVFRPVFLKDSSRRARRGEVDYFRKLNNKELKTANLIKKTMSRNGNLDLEGLLEMSRLLDHHGGGPRQWTNGSQRGGLNCVFLPNSSIACREDIYSNPVRWKESLDRVDHMISQLRIKLEKYKVIRRQLKKNRPVDAKHCNCNNAASRYPLMQTAPAGDLAQPMGQWFDGKMKKKERKMRRKANQTCNVEKMNCFTHNNDHWKTPPFWTEGPFCFCQNANNNTYWCVRTINATHNYLYCEFITGFITYYDLRVDPYQLRNVVHQLSSSQLLEMQLTLSRLRSCRGAKECTVRHQTVADTEGRGMAERDFPTLTTVEEEPS